MTQFEKPSRSQKQYASQFFAIFNIQQQREDSWNWANIFSSIARERAHNSLFCYHDNGWEILQSWISFITASVGAMLRELPLERELFRAYQGFSFFKLSTRKKLLSRCWETQPHVSDFEVYFSHLQLTLRTPHNRQNKFHSQCAFCYHVADAALSVWRHFFPFNFKRLCLANSFSCLCEAF